MTRDEAKKQIAKLLAERETVLASDKAKSEALYQEAKRLWPIAFGEN